MSQKKSHNRNVNQESKKQTEVSGFWFIITLTGNPADNQVGNKGREHPSKENDYPDYKKIEKSPLLYSVDSEWLNQGKK